MSQAGNMNIEDELRHFITAEIVPEGVQDDELLISSGKVDSLGLISILGFIDQTFGKGLMVSANPEDFESVNALAAAIRRAQGKS